MDLGCLDLGCLDAVDKHCRPHSSSGSDGSGSDFRESISSSASKFGKKSSPRGSGQSTNALNKFRSQIKKPTRRKTSPLNWFPRKKGDSYLKRKIQMLQEVDGMKQTLDETLEDSNPHYCRVLREKIAAREAARKVMEAQKAALVEASWCRILKAARIQSMEAEDLLLKAEKAAAEAFEAATAVGVIMDDMPNFPHSPSLLKPSTICKARSTTHSVKVSFETAFDVDKEVAAAVRTAFIKLANSGHCNEDEFRDLLKKISQNPEASVGDQELTDCSSESESDSGFKAKAAAENNESVSPESRQRKHKKRQSLELVNMMLKRLKSLKEDELSSLATIVATCGLSAALAEIESTKLRDPISNCYISSEAPKVPRRLSSADVGPIGKKQAESELPSLDKFLVKHKSKLEREVEQAKNNRKKELGEGQRENPSADYNDGKSQLNKRVSPCEVVPDLGTILVKYSSRFEREILEAKKNSAKDFEIGHYKLAGGSDSSSEVIPDLASMLVERPSNRANEIQDARKDSGNSSSTWAVKREILEAKKNSAKDFEIGHYKLAGGSDSSSEVIPDLASMLVKRPSNRANEIQDARKDSGNSSSTWAVKRTKDIVPDVPSLDKCLVKHVSRLEREVQEAKSRTKDSVQEAKSRRKDSESRNDKVAEKENADLNKQAMASQSEQVESLEKMLIKPGIHGLEREKMEAKSKGSEYNRMQQTNCESNEAEGLEKVLIKHVSKLEKEKMEWSMKEGVVVNVERSGRKSGLQRNEEGSLEQILVKQKSRLEKEKMSGLQEWGGKERVVVLSSSMARRQAREKELQEAWDGLSFGNSLRPHLSKLEKDKAAWIKAEEEERRQLL